MTYLAGHNVDADMTELLSDGVVLSLLVSLRCLLLHSALYVSEILFQYTLRLIAAHAPSFISCTVSAGRSPSEQTLQRRSHLPIGESRGATCGMLNEEPILGALFGARRDVVGHRAASWLRSFVPG